MFDGTNIILREHINLKWREIQLFCTIFFFQVVSSIKIVRKKINLKIIAYINLIFLEFFFLVFSHNYVILFRNEYVQDMHT